MANKITVHDREGATIESALSVAHMEVKNKFASMYVSVLFEKVNEQSTAIIDEAMQHSDLTLRGVIYPMIEPLTFADLAMLFDGLSLASMFIEIRGRGIYTTPTAMLQNILMDSLLWAVRRGYCGVEWDTDPTETKYVQFALVIEAGIDDIPF